MTRYISAYTAATVLLSCGDTTNAERPIRNFNNYQGQQQCADGANGECIDDKPKIIDAATTNTNTNANANTKTNDNDEDPVGQCQLYLAPSSLPHAGLGLFYGGSTPIPIDHALTSTSTQPDLVLPILDKYKAHPFRGQQRFPSYLAYIWPESPGALASELTSGDGGPANAFPSVPEVLWDMDTGLDGADGMKFYWDDVDDDDETTQEYDEKDYEEEEAELNAFVPGLATLANHHSELNNMDRVYYEDEDEESEEAGVEYVAIKPLRAGMELLFDYGSDWEETNDVKLSYIERQKKRTDGNNIRQKEGFINGIDTKWDRLDKRELYKLPEELPTEKAKRERLAVGYAADSSEVAKDGKRPFSEYRENDLLEHDENDDDGYDYRDVHDMSLWVGYPRTPQGITKPLSYLGENGVCISSDKLAVGPSNIKAAGRGLHSTTSIHKGETIISSPLIAMRKEDFIIYKSDPTHEFKSKVLDKTKVLGMELLINYAFAHPDSPLYLVPTAPLANFINHDIDANVQIRWPQKGSNTAKLFEWAYNQRPGSHFQNSFEDYSSSSSSAFTNPNPWLDMHPIDVMERSGKLALEYVALRDIEEGEEILIDYGDLWAQTWSSHTSNNDDKGKRSFRHPIGVPSGFYPKNWLHVTDQYEIAELQDLENKPLPTGVALPITWAHNGKPVGSKYAYVIGLEKGFSDRFLKYAEENGVIELYRRLLTEQEGYRLPSDGFNVYDTGTLVNKTLSETEETLEFFAHRYAAATRNRKFNMHFTAAWNEAARKSVLAALGDSGFDAALNAIGQRFGYDNMTCFHSSYMGHTHCEKSIMHSDIYATNDKSWNMVFPLITVGGTEPELDIMAEDMNTIVGVNYLKDVVYAMGDFGYHQTRPMADYNPHEDQKDYGDLAANGVPIRVVFGTYCSQIDETNVATIRHIYDGDDPAPFADQFVDLPMREIHWDRATRTASLAKPGGKGT